MALVAIAVTAPAARGVTPPSASIVQLGDSIAAGEGTRYGYRYDQSTQTWIGGDIDAKWPGPYPDCHDSPAAYGSVVAQQLGARFHQFACTGATFENGITTAQTFSQLLTTTTLRPAQFGNWRTRKHLNRAYTRARPDLVLATFGADDSEFSTIVRDCILNGYAYAVGLASLACTADNPGSSVTAHFVDLVEKGTLAAHYRLLARWIRARARAEHQTRPPAIVFTTYPDPLPPRGQICPDSKQLYPEQLVYLQSLIDEMNDVIIAAVDGSHDPRVAVADASRAYVGHTWCTPDPWAYGLSIYSLTDPSSLKSQAPFHPTPRGQRAIAAAVAPTVKRLLED
ncbi:MAG TPA: SGNH/GDSL hydrolase family protein [Acidimicrobiia bacterium]